MIKIAVDLLGADRSETELLEGVIDAINENTDLFVYILGTKEILENELNNKGVSPDRYEVIDAPDVITNHDNPMEIIRSKSNASMIKGATLCRDNEEVGAFVSCGATGALMVSSMFIIKPLSPAITPVLVCEFIKRNGEYICLADCGANLDCPADKIVSFAKMGSAYMSAKGVENPKVRLLSNGAEDTKGTAVIKEANALLKEADLNFLGNIEGSSVLESDADVIATDGYSGNVLLKTLECGAVSVIKDIRDYAETLESEDKGKFLSLADKLYKHYDYNTQGGAVLLGVKKPVIKGHGAATAETILSIVRIAYTLAKNNLVDKIKEEFNI
ncbi:MAG: phosphate acyltransferase PlsX [Clostridia bacterium]|nr:phosphate acyltransferase PlsX [Clostridia bacterium]